MPPLPLDAAGAAHCEPTKDGDKMIKLARLLPAFALVLAFGACTADVEDEGELPNVEVEGGDAPNIDLDPADVDISTDTQQVVVPDVDVNAREDTI